MKVYIVEMWVYGSEWASLKQADYKLVAKSFDIAKDGLANGEEWSVGKISEFNLDTGDYICCFYFEQEYYGKYDKTFVEEAEFNELYDNYR